MRSKAALAGTARTVLWAAGILAAGVLLAGLAGRGLARALPAGGTAEPLPVYTSLSLAAEDEPMLPLWQRYDPEQTVAAEEGEMGTSLEGLDQYLFWPLGVYCLWEEPPQEPLPFEKLETEEGAGYYLLQYPLPGAVMLTDLSSGRMEERSGVRMDLAFGWNSADGYQISLRLDIPEEEEATADQLDLAVYLVRNQLCDFLAGRRETLLGIPREGLYSLTDGIPSELLDRLQERVEAGGEVNAEAELQQLCDAQMLDVQLIRLENEVLLTVTDRYGSGMLCLYCDARLRCVSGVALQLAW